MITNSLKFFEANKNVIYNLLFSLFERKHHCSVNNFMFKLFHKTFFTLLKIIRF